MRGSELDGEEVLLRAGAAYDDSDVIRRTGCRTQALHLLHQEGDEGAGILDAGLRLLVEVGLVGRAAALGHAKEVVLHTFGSLDVYLGRQVALGVHLIVHVQGSVLAVAQIALRVRLVHTQRQRFLIAEARPHLLALLSVYDGRTRVLAEGKQPLAGYLGIAQEGESHVFVVLTCLGVVQDLGHLFVVGAAQHEADIVESLVGHARQGLGGDLEYLVSLELADGDTLLGQQIILGIVLAQLEHGGVPELWCLCHSLCVLCLVTICRFESLSI